MSQQQPGFSGRVISGIVALRGAAPPAGSTLFLGLVKGPSDQQPRTCIDAERNPVNEEGQFYAQVGCQPQSGDQLMYVLVVGPSGNRDWHQAVVPIPSDLQQRQAGRAVRAAIAPPFTRFKMLSGALGDRGPARKHFYKPRSEMNWQRSPMRQE